MKTQRALAGPCPGRMLTPGQHMEKRSPGPGEPGWPWLGARKGAPGLGEPRAACATRCCCSLPEPEPEPAPTPAGCLAAALRWGFRVRGGQSGETLDAWWKETDYFCMTRDENFNAWLQITNVFCCGTLIKLLLPAGVLSCCECSVFAARPAPPPRHSDANWHCAHF